MVWDHGLAAETLSSSVLYVHTLYLSFCWPSDRSFVQSGDLLLQLAFVVLQLVLRYIATNMEKDFILSTNPHQGKTFRVRTGFSKDTGTYEVEFVDRKSEATGKLCYKEPSLTFLKAARRPTNRRNPSPSTSTSKDCFTEISWNYM